MKFLIRPTFFLFSLLFTSAGFAQGDVPEFTVQVGNFVNPKPADFTALQKTGFVYTIARPSSHTDVFLGGYTSGNAAQKVANDLKGQGFSNAFVSQLNTDGGQSVSVIQLATHQVGDKLNWEKFLQAGQVFVLLNNNQVKILAGGFADMAAAKAQLSTVRGLGFKDAFVKNVNNALLHEVTEFETGGLAKKPLIPLDFAKAEPATAEKPDARPKSYGDDTPIIVRTDQPVLTAKGGGTRPTSAAFSFKADMPEIRSNVKRTSAINLQKVLKTEGTYKGSLDGYYGKGTRGAYEQALLTDRQLQKYSILSEHLPPPGNDAPVGSLQYFVNSLWNGPQASMDGLEKSRSPIAKAYRAYYLLVNDGPSRDVNKLMNTAIDEVYSTWKAGRAPHIDPSSTYAYEGLDQLLKHLRYIHVASNDDVAVPCWMFRRHPGTALKAFGDEPGNSVTVENCGGFWDWKEFRLLNAIAADLCTQGHASEGKMSDSHAELARLYLTPKAQSWPERKALMDWDENVWKGINAWSTRDPMLAEIGTALKISYFQTQVLLEDYFMDEGFDEKEAKGLALAALKSLVGHHFERFV